MGDLGRWLLGRGGLSQDLFEDAGWEVFERLWRLGRRLVAEHAQFLAHQLQGTVAWAIGT